MLDNFPLLRDRDFPPHLPIKGGGCLICGAPLQNGPVYLSAGASSPIDDQHEDEPVMSAFFQIGYHSPAVDCTGSANVDIVHNLNGGQFDLSFCSTSCLRHFFQVLVNKLEQGILENGGVIGS
jgi:hypothetical protein